MLFCEEYIDEELVEKAQAMLATCRRRMTGMEIDMCEKLAAMTYDYDWVPFALTLDQFSWFNNMTIQFSREIAEWIDQHGRVTA